MVVRVLPCRSDEAYIIGNLYPLYLNDLSAYSGDMPNAHGVLMPDEPDARDADAYAPLYDFWWQHPGVLRPFLIRVDEHAAGFALTSSPSLGIPHWQAEIVELFVVGACRGRGVARQALRQILPSLGGTPGQRGVRVLAGNARALGFWRAALTAEQLSCTVEEKVIEGRELALVVF